jgi:hypothetical protein
MQQQQSTGGEGFNPNASGFNSEGFTEQGPQEEKPKQEGPIDADFEVVDDK